MYYHNYHTNVTTWVIPDRYVPANAPVSEWDEYVYQNGNMLYKYYHNVNTGVTTWDVPLQYTR